MKIMQVLENFNKLDDRRFCELYSGRKKFKVVPFSTGELYVMNRIVFINGHSFPIPVNINDNNVISDHRSKLFIQKRRDEAKNFFGHLKFDVNIIENGELKLLTLKESEAIRLISLIETTGVYDIISESVNGLTSFQSSNVEFPSIVLKGRQFTVAECTKNVSTNAELRLALMINDLVSK